MDTAIKRKHRRKIIVPDDSLRLAQEIRTKRIAEEVARVASRARLDSEYRRALGLAEGEPLPASLGNIPAWVPTGAVVLHGTRHGWLPLEKRTRQARPAGE